MRKCNYCDFISLDNSTAQFREDYVGALISGIERFPRAFEALGGGNGTHGAASPLPGTAFFGGGTPNVLSLNQLGRIMDAIHKHWDTSQLREVSIEINPSADTNFAALKAIGFNRISIGVQSFDNADLRVLTRLHSATTAEDTLYRALKHFDNVGIDLIYGVPGQTIASFECSLNKAVRAGVPHISAYNMTYERNTELYKQAQRGQCQPVNEDTELAMYELLCGTLSKADIHQYEVSNFARRGAECLHNQNYWERGDYIGFGAAAHSLLGNVRFANTGNVAEYILQQTADSPQYESIEALTAVQIAEERLFLGLRSGGIKADWLNKKQAGFMQDCVERGFATKEADTFVLNSRGRFITDSIALGLIVNY